MNVNMINIDSPVRAVLFDLSGTTLDEGYIRDGLAAVTAEVAERWNIDPDVASASFMPLFRAVSAKYASQSFYLMSDVLCETLAQMITAAGRSASREELLKLEQLMWAAAIPTAVATEGAIGTLTLLAESGIRTGIVSYSDVHVFRRLLEQTGLAGLTDIELCSEDARSCKPDPAIFLQALAAVDTSPQDALFVGDSVEVDIVGANRVGMSSALLTGREFTMKLNSTAQAEPRPTHRIANLIDVVNLVLGDRHPLPVAATS